MASRRGSRTWTLPSRGTLVTLGVALVVAATAGGWMLRARSRERTLRYLEGVAQIQLGLGKPEEAVRALEEALELAPDKAENVVLLAQAHNDLHRRDEAERILRSAHERRPENATMLVALATQVLSRGRAHEALGLLAPRVAELRRLPTPYARTTAFLTAGRAAAAIAAVTTAESLLREAADHAAGTGRDVVEARGAALLALGTVLENEARLAESEAALREARALVPEAAPVALELAAVLERAGRPVAARDLLRDFLKCGSKERTLVAPPLAELLARLGQTADVEAVIVSCTQDPLGLALVPHVRAASALARGDRAGAAQEFRRLSESFPRAARPHLLAARAAQAAGDLARARADLAAALRADADALEAELGLLELDRIDGAVAGTCARALRLLARDEARAAALGALLDLPTAARSAPGVVAALDSLAAERPSALVRLFAGALRLERGDARGSDDVLAACASRGELDREIARDLQAGRLDLLEALEDLAALAIREPRFAPVRLALAGLLAQVGLAHDAERLVDAQATLEPADGPARLLRARTRAAHPTPALAAEVAALGTLALADAWSCDQLAEVHLQLRDFDAVVRWLDRAHELAPGDARVLARLGRARALVADHAGARRAFEEAQRIDPALVPARQDGALLVALGRHGEAVERLARAFESTRDARFLAARGGVLALTGSTDAALAAFEQLGAAAPGLAASAEATVARMLVLALAGRAPREPAHHPEVPDEVLAASAAPHDRDDSRRALEMFALGMLGWSEELAVRADEVAKDPSRGLALTWWALRGLRPDAPPTVRLDVASRIARETQHPRAWLDLAHAQAAAGQPKGARETLERVVELDPERRDARFELAQLLESSGDAAGAIASYRKLLGKSDGRSDDADAAVLNNLACLLAERRDERVPALELALLALRREPLVGAFHDTLGWLHAQHGLPHEAELHLARAVLLAPAAGDHRAHLAVALEALGSPRRAAHHAERALGAAESRGEALAAKILERERARRTGR